MAQEFVHSWRRALCAEDLTVPSTARLVGLVLSMDGKVDGSDCRPGATKLSRQCHLSVSATRKALALLVDMGWLKEVSRGGRKKRPREATTYQLRIPQREPETTRSSALPVGQTVGNGESSNTPLGSWSADSSSDNFTAVPDPTAGIAAVRAALPKHQRTGSVTPRFKTHSRR